MLLVLNVSTCIGWTHSKVDVYGYPKSANVPPMAEYHLFGLCRHKIDICTSSTCFECGGDHELKQIPLDRILLIDTGCGLCLFCKLLQPNGELVWWLAQIKRDKALL